MKAFILVFIFLISSWHGYSQDTRTSFSQDYAKRNVIKINPLSLAISNLSFSYERIINDRIGVQLQAGFWLGGKVLGTKWSGTSFTPEVRYYITPEVRPRGFYVAAFGRYQEITTVIEKANSTFTLNRIGGGVAVGYQLLLGEMVAWDIFLGPQYLVNSGSKDDISSRDFGQYMGNFGLRLGTTFGIAF